MSGTNLTLKEIEDLATMALVGAGASAENAAAVARSTVKAERDGIRSHGLMYVPIYAEHVVCGKVNGLAAPVVEHSHPGAIRVDAQSGFAHPAIDAGWPAFTKAARENGVAALTIYNSYNCGVLGHHAERLAEERLHPARVRWNRPARDLARVQRHQPELAAKVTALRRRFERGRLNPR